MTYTLQGEDPALTAAIEELRGLAELDGIAAKNAHLTRQLKELSARLRQNAKRPATKTAAKRPRPRKKKS